MLHECACWGAARLVMNGLQEKTKKGKRTLCQMLLARAPSGRLWAMSGWTNQSAVVLRGGLRIVGRAADQALHEYCANLCVGDRATATSRDVGGRAIPRLPTRCAAVRPKWETDGIADAMSRLFG